jgi:hypothetical protein
MYLITRATYILLLSYNPCELFNHFEVEQLHGLYKVECLKHENSSTSAYIAGLSNFIPKVTGDYSQQDKRFIYINLSRCNDDISTMSLVMHETMHHSLWLHEYDVENQEEEIITWAENEALELINIIKKYKNDNDLIPLEDEEDQTKN